MKQFLFILSFIICMQASFSQISTSYTLTFENAVHHQAQISATFTNLIEKDVEFRMSRTSPGRYALHEFVKNIYDLKATDEHGKTLKLERLDPYSWNVSGHNGTINLTYILFANHGDGTYAQIDETHAHLNAPATFLYAPSLAENEIEINFNLPKNLSWKVATQLKYLKGNTYYAKNLHYLMDSPMEISNHELRSFETDGQTIQFALHHKGTPEEFNSYFENTKKIITQQKAIFGELPTFDYGTYIFLGCYLPQVDGDGMEHRNSTVLTSTKSLAKGAKRNIGTVSHEFFHCWNVERIRPKSLEPFDYEFANMSGELWFAEGFTSYYGGLAMCRAGLTSQKEYIIGMQGAFNYVWASPGRKFSSPIEMSNQAPFVDAAKAVDQVAYNNVFISYYSYGQMIGLALDLSLRNIDLTLDAYMKLVWHTYGKNETAYTNENLHATLNEFAGSAFGDAFFNNYVFGREMPDFEQLFQPMGVQLSIDTSQVTFGASVDNHVVMDYPLFETMAYNAGLTKGDNILQIGNTFLNKKTDFNTIFNQYGPDDSVKIVFERFGEKGDITLQPTVSKKYVFQFFEEIDKPITEAIKSNRNSWLQAK